MAKQYQRKEYSHRRNENRVKNRGMFPHLIPAQRAFVNSTKANSNFRKPKSIQMIDFQKKKKIGQWRGKLIILLPINSSFIIVPDW